MPALPKFVVIPAILVILGAAAFTWLDVVQMLRQAAPVAPMRPPPEAIEWGNQVFRSPAELERWLHSRGASYSHWRKRFPAEARVLEHRPPPPTTTIPVSNGAANAVPAERTNAGATKATAKRNAAPSAAAADDGGARRGVIVAFVLAALATVILIVTGVVTVTQSYHQSRRARQD